MAWTLKRIVKGQALVPHILESGEPVATNKLFLCIANPVNNPKSISASGHEIMDQRGRERDREKDRERKKERDMEREREQTP